MFFFFPLHLIVLLTSSPFASSSSLASIAFLKSKWEYFLFALLYCFNYSWLISGITGLKDWVTLANLLTPCWSKESFCAGMLNVRLLLKILFFIFKEWGLNDKGKASDDYFSIFDKGEWVNFRFLKEELTPLKRSTLTAVFYSSSDETILGVIIYVSYFRLLFWLAPSSKNSLGRGFSNRGESWSLA